MKVCGVSVVRNEADTIALCVRHNLSLGLDALYIVDNGSSDGTDRILQRLADEDERVKWTRDGSAYKQGEILTRLAREAWREGADWIVPFDADEFWSSGGEDFRSLLAESRAVALRVDVVNFIQRTTQETSSQRALQYMTRRVAAPVGPLEKCRELVESNRIAFVEMMYPPKWISRASADLLIAPGNHQVGGMDGPYMEAREVVILHAPLRSRASLQKKAEHGRRIEEVVTEPCNHWHVRRFLRLEREGGLDLEWRANSYANETINVYGIERRVIYDTRLHDAVTKVLDEAERITFDGELTAPETCQHAPARQARDLTEATRER